MHRKGLVPSDPAAVDGKFPILVARLFAGGLALVQESPVHVGDMVGRRQWPDPAQLPLPSLSDLNHKRSQIQFAQTHIHNRL